MVFSKERSRSPQLTTTELTPSQKRRFRRKKLQAIKEPTIIDPNCKVNLCNEVSRIGYTKNKIKSPDCYSVGFPYLAAAAKKNPFPHDEFQINKVSAIYKQPETASTSGLAAMDEKSAKEAKKQVKKEKGDGGKVKVPSKDESGKDKKTPIKDKPIGAKTEDKTPKCRDEVDKACIKETKPIESSTEVVKTKEQVLAERAAKKAAKQAKKKGTGDVAEVAPNPDMTVKDVVETLKDIKNVAKDIQDITAKPTEKPVTDKAKTDNKVEETAKSKAELKAERRAKQEAQRAAKQAATEQKAAKVKTEAVKPKTETAGKVDSNVAKEKSPKPKSTDKPKAKPASANRVNWFQHLYAERDEEALNKIALNSNIHPAIIKLGVQSTSHVVDGSNARCIALLDALKKLVRDYSLPAKTEFGRGLESHLSSNLTLLWSLRPPCAAQDNAVKYFRRQLTQLPNNINEFDAKKILQEEIDRYIDDQIDKAGEAISMAVQKKISTGDNILTYAYSSLIERILREAWEAKLKFRTVVVGDRIQDGARNMLRRLTAAGLPTTYVDITAVSYIMKTVSKVLLGAGSLLGNGSVLGAAGSAQVSLIAREHNVPVLVACETHKFSPRVQTDAFVYNELGDPDALIDKNDENSPLKDWRSNPNLTPLNLTYDVTPASLVTAVVTEKAILPCTSAPVVLRTKLTEYGM